jgi:ribosomal protein S18 acetylase RimI-like enzyme
MVELREASVKDLLEVASWIRSPEDCHRWAGNRLRFPIDRAILVTELEFDVARSFGLFDADTLVAFGQIVPKALGRAHLARLIVDPERRNEGLGRAISANLLRVASTSENREISLNVDSANVVAVALYRSLHFAQADRPEDEPHSDALYMELVT